MAGRAQRSKGRGRDPIPGRGPNIRGGVTLSSGVRGMSGTRTKVKLGLPKGSLQQATIDTFHKAGFTIVCRERSYFPTVNDEELDLLLVRAQEMPRYVEEGALDCGVTGEDWIRENEAQVVRVAELDYAKQGRGRVRWVLAVPKDGPIRTVKDLRGKRVATELVRVTKAYLARQHVRARVEFSWGATEVKVGAGLADAIVELTETGSSLRANGLDVLETVCESTTQLIANRRAWRDPWRREKIDRLALLLRGAVQAAGKVGLKLNVSQGHLRRVLALLPAMRQPTVSPLSQGGWVAVETVIDELLVRTLVPELKAAGAEGIIEYALNKVIP